MDLTTIDECPDCASQNIVFSRDREQVICRDCGLIFEPPVVKQGGGEVLVDLEKREFVTPTLQKLKVSAAKKPAKSRSKTRSILGSIKSAISRSAKSRAKKSKRAKR